MTTPTLSPFHQKNPPHKAFGSDSRLQSKIQNPGICASRERGEKFNIQNRCVAPLTPSSLNPFIPLRTMAAFTLIELLAVITIIGILAGLTLGAAGAVRRHGATSTAKAEVAALQAACDRYYADCNVYPTTNSMPDPSSTSSANVNPSTSASYSTAGKVLFNSLFGTNQYNLPPSTKRYFEPKPAMVSSAANANPYFIDPWGYAYGYNSDGTNAPLIWSTAGQTNSAGTNKWITSWPKM